MTDNSFGKVNKFGIVEDTGFFQAIGLAYKEQIDSDSGIFGKAWAGVKSPVYGTVNYACHHPYKTAAVFLAIAAVTSLTAAYFLSPAYAGFVNTTAASTYAGTMAGVKGLFALAAANPVFTGLLTTAIVVTVGTLIYMNYSKANQIKEQANQIDGVKKAVLEACEKDDQGKPKLQNEKIKMADKNDPSQVLTNVAVKLGLAQVQTQATA